MSELITISPAQLSGFGKGHTFHVLIPNQSGTITWYVYKALTKESAFATLLSQEKVLHNYRSHHFQAPEVDHLDQNNQEQLYAALAFKTRPKPYTKSRLLKRVDRNYEPTTFLGQAGKAHLDPEHEIKLTKIVQLLWIGAPVPPSGYDDAGLYPATEIPDALRFYLDRSLYPVAVVNPTGGGEFLYEDPLYGRITYTVKHRRPNAPLKYRLETYLLYLCLYDRPRTNDLVAVLEHGLDKAVASMLWGLREYGDLETVSPLVREDAEKRSPARPLTKFNWFFFKLRFPPYLTNPPKHPRALVNGLIDSMAFFVDVTLEDLVNRGFLDVTELSKTLPPQETSTAYGLWKGLSYLKLVRDGTTGQIHVERAETTPDGPYVFLHRDGRRVKVVTNQQELKARAPELYRQGFLKAVPAPWLRHHAPPLVSRTFYV